jgi:DNA-binding beta-propeller fold protein YncE
MTITDQITGSFIHRPHGLAIAKDFSRAYVTANDGNYFVSLSIDTTTGRFTGGYTETVLKGTAPMPSVDVGPYQCVLSSDEKRLYIACSSESALYVYDVSKDEPKLKKKIVSPGAAQCNEGLGLYPKLLTLADDKIFVVCYKEKCARSENRGREGCVSVFDEEGNWIKNIYGLGHQPHGIDYDAANGRLWITCENQGGESHHAGPNSSLSPGQVNAVRVSDLSVVYDVPREVPPFPTGGVVIR